MKRKSFMLVLSVVLMITLMGSVIAESPADASNIVPVAGVPMITLNNGVKIFLHTQRPLFPALEAWNYP